jgi:hypothetical protein
MRYISELSIILAIEIFALSFGIAIGSMALAVMSSFGIGISLAFLIVLTGDEHGNKKHAKK